MARPSHAGDENASHTIEVEVLPTPGATARGTLQGIDPESVRVRFANAQAPALCIARGAELRFYSKPGQAPFSVRASTCFRSDGEGQREYGFSFPDRDTVRKHLMPYLFGAQNRRSFVRVRPALGSPIQVALEARANSSRLTGKLIDISEGGMAVQIRPDDEDAFVDVVRGAVEFRLPGETVQRMAVLIRQRRLVGTTVQFGLSFEADESRLFEEQRRAIWKYVFERQRARYANTG